MPAVPSGSKVLVTGANGYIAMWVVRTALERGFAVRATVRSEAKAGHLRKTFSSYGDKLEVVIVEDICKPGAFDEAVRGVVGVEHTASPVNSHTENPDDLIIPAVNGTVGILESVLKYGTDVKRVVITSSCATVLTNGLPEPRTFSEKDWNHACLAEVREKGRGANNIDKYRASKIMAEQSATDFIAKHKDSIKWDHVILNPPYVFGPPIQEVASPDKLNQSSLDFYNTVVLGKLGPAMLVHRGNSWIDVRDCALAHVLALEKEEAGGERIIISSGPYFWQDFILAANAISPPIYDNLTKGNTEYDPKKAEYFLKYDVSKEQRILGIKYRTIAETTKDVLIDFKSRGW